MKKYFIQKFDPQKPVYEADYVSKTWKLVATANGNECDPGVRGKLRPTSFTSYQFTETTKPKNLTAA